MFTRDITKLSYLSSRRTLFSEVNQHLGVFLSLQEQMTRARDGRVLALGPIRCHADHDDDDGGDEGRLTLDALFVDDRS